MPESAINLPPGPIMGPSMPPRILVPIPGYPPDVMAVYSFSGTVGAGTLGLPASPPAGVLHAVPPAAPAVPSLSSGGDDDFLAGVSPAAQHVTSGNAREIPGTALKGDDPRIRFIFFPRKGPKSPQGFTRIESVAAVQKIYSRDLRRFGAKNKDFWIYAVNPASSFSGRPHLGVVRAAHGIIIRVGDVKPSAMGNTKLPSVVTIPGYTPGRG